MENVQVARIRPWMIKRYQRDYYFVPVCQYPVDDDQGIVDGEIGRLRINGQWKQRVIVGPQADG